MINNFNWKKIASATMKQQDAELAFAKTASSIIEDKAQPFFKEPYYLGFEIVKSNDSFSKMIGIFVFRVEKNLFYTPVFYIDGKIKGTDLLYNVDEKLFGLLSPDWCDYYLDKIESNSGDALKPGSSKDATQDLQLRWLAYPPYMAKGASAKLTRKEDYKPLSPLSIFGLIKEAKEELSKEDFETAFKNWKNDKSYEDRHLVRSLIKKGGYEMFDKLASWIENDPKFANNFVTFCDVEEDLLQKDVLAEKRLEQQTKSANIKIASIKDKEIPEEIKNKGKNQIRIYKGRFNPFTNKTAAEQIADGYSIEDTREETSLQPVIVNPLEQFNGLDSGVGYGVYNMLKSDGDIAKVFVISNWSDNNKRPALIIDCEQGDDTAGLIWYDNVSDKKNLLGRDFEPVEPAGKHKQEIPFSEILFDRILDNNFEEDIIKRFLKDKPEVGGIYGIYDSKNSYISDEAFYIDAITDREDGGYTISAYPAYGYEFFEPKRAIYPENEITIRVNPESSKIHLDLKVFTKDTQWIKIPFKKVKLSEGLKDVAGSIDDTMSTKASDFKYVIKQQDYVPGTLSTFYKLANELNLKMASVKFNPINNKFTLSSAKHSKEFKNIHMNKLATVVQLMHDFNYSEDQAKEITDKAVADPSKPYEFFYKTAARIILNPDPDWYEGYDSDLGVKYEVPETRVLATQATEFNAPAPRYGDHQPTFTDVVNQTTEPMTTGEDKIDDVFLRTASPNMLADLAVATGKGSLFEHGILGSLAKANESSSLIAEYLPDLYQGQDKIGRLIFLMFSAPQLFLELYGSDDLSSIENTLVSLFKQQGEMLLELSKRSKGVQLNLTSVETRE